MVITLADGRRTKEALAVWPPDLHVGDVLLRTAQHGWVNGVVTGAARVGLWWQVATDDARVLPLAPATRCEVLR